MKLQRYNPVSHNPLQYDPEMTECDDGEYYRTADVDAMLARIRAAVADERAATVADTGNASGWVARITKYRAALDALLSDGECSTLCAPGSGERCMVTDSGRCPNGGS